MQALTELLTGKRELAVVQLCFKDTVNIFKVRKDEYGNDVPQSAVAVPALYEQVTGFEHGNNRDSVSSASRLYLPGDDEFVVENGQRLEGMVVQINPFGAEGSEQYFRISNVTPVRDILLCNEVQHVECDLRKVEGFSNAC